MAEDGGMLVPDDIAEELMENFGLPELDPKTGRWTRKRIIEKKAEPKKKKSIYSRKLRTKRRK